MLWFAVIHFSAFAHAQGGDVIASAGLIADIATTEDRTFFVSRAGLFEWKNGHVSLLQQTPDVRLLAIDAVEASEGTMLVVAGGEPGESGHVGVSLAGQKIDEFVRFADDLIYDVAVNSMGDRVALACGDGRVLVGHFEDGAVQNPSVLLKHTSVVRSVAFAPDGIRLASASLDGLVLVTKTAGSEAPIVLQDHSDKVECVVFTPDSQQVVSGARDGKVRFHSVEGRLVRTYSNWGDLKGARPWDLSNQILSLCFSPDGRSLIAGTSLGYLLGLSLDAGSTSVIQHFEKPINAISMSDRLLVGAEQLHEIDLKALPQ